MNKGTNSMLDTLSKYFRAKAGKRPLAYMKQTDKNVSWNYSAVMCKVIRSKSETRLIDEEDFYNNLCRDKRSIEELKLEKSTLASSRRIMSIMLEQKKDISRHLEDFRRLRREIEAKIKWMEKDVAAVE